ncbi:MAG: hypothetical protein VYD19_07010 [Myxococcota bacterium]|nr:hypothetical protein [Myxococcota bacterium]
MADLGDATHWLRAQALSHLETVVAIDSCSDPNSQTVPSSEGQRALTERLRTRFGDLGAEVEVDQFANLIARYPGRGAGVNAAPIALMIHLDTAPGTVAVPTLSQHPNWGGDALTFAKNERLTVDEHHYPSLSAFRGHQLIHGPGDVPFGLDDKLGLTHLLSLATLLAGGAEAEALVGELDLPPVWLIGRPDEEIGRDDALFGLAEKLSAAGVRRGYTIDGIDAFEVNVANFFAAEAMVTLSEQGIERLPEGIPLTLTLGGVNTHGATAKAEGHRGAIRWLVELWRASRAEGVRLCDFKQDSGRECDGKLSLWAPDLAAAAKLRAATRDIVEVHIPRGASLRFEATEGGETVTQCADLGLEQLAGWLGECIWDRAPTEPLLAEDSEGWSGYSHPAGLTKSTPHSSEAGQSEAGCWTLRWRLRDFEREALEGRARWIEAALAHLEGADAHFQWRHQYENMGPRLAEAPELTNWACRAAERVGVEAKIQPIRGGTGINPFLDAGVLVANLGTGYFSPESEKELTSLELMSAHALWLLMLLNESLSQ